MKKTGFLVIFLTIVYPSFAQNSYLNQLADCKEKIKVNNPILRAPMIGNCLTDVIAPNFEVVSLSGDTIRLVDLREQVVVINFWFTTCPPCVAEIQGLNEIVTEFKYKPVTFIAISPDSQATIEAFIQKHPFDFILTADTEFVFRSVFNLNYGFGYPTTIVLDKGRKIKKITSGGRVDEQATKAIRATLIPVIEECLK